MSFRDSDEFELNGLTLVQCAKSGAFDRRDMYEHILPPSWGWMKP